MLLMLVFRLPSSLTSLGICYNKCLSYVNSSMKETGKSKFDSLDESLYSRTRYQNPLEKRSDVRAVDLPEVEEKWEGEPLDQMLMRERKEESTHPMLKKFFIFAALFFAATVVIAGVVFFGGVNFVSSKNVDINVVGPATASAGEVLALSVTIENKNNTDLELANFSAQFPQGSRDPKDTSKTLTYERESLGVIKAGDEEVKNVSVVLLGSKGEEKELKFSVEYKVKGSNATFYKEKFYKVTIGNTPVSIQIESPRMVTAGETFETTVSVTLNSTEILKNALLKAEYPYGYSVAEATPAAALENNVWALGDLSPGVVKKIKIKGKLSGENQEERTFRFYLGVGENAAVTPNFKTVILSDQDTVLIERPAVGLNISFNGENSLAYTAPAGKEVQVAIRFQNNMTEKLLAPRLEARLTGSTLNKSSVSVQGSGSYNSATNRVSWNLTNNQGQAELAPGESGQVIFSFASLPEAVSSGSNQEIGLQFVVTGTPVDSLQAISLTDTRSIKLAAQVSLASKTLHSTGSFINSGPIPPKVGEATTYTIVWSAGNTQGDVMDSRISGRLGTNVKWVAAKSFSSEDVSYDEKTNTVIWNMGTLAADTGFSKPGRELSFQVTLTPSAAQAGLTPTLVTGIVFSGRDTSSGKTITVTNSPLTTKMPSDPAFIQGNDIVVK